LQKLIAAPIETPEQGMASEFSGALVQLQQRADETEWQRLTAKRLGDLSDEEKQRLRELQLNRSR
jgi:hypothetical protein